MKTMIRARGWSLFATAIDVVAVEVFRPISEVPPEFRQYARRGMYNCGVYLYWSEVRW